MILALVMIFEYLAIVSGTAISASYEDSFQYLLLTAILLIAATWISMFASCELQHKT